MSGARYKQNLLTNDISMVIVKGNKVMLLPNKILKKSNPSHVPDFLFMKCSKKHRAKSEIFH